MSRHAAAATLLVLAKAPVPGSVKTRLCPPLTAAQAAEVAAAALLDTLDTVADAAGPDGAVVALDGDPGAGVHPGELLASLRRFRVAPQRGNGLAERIVAAHLDASPPNRRGTLQIGMDTPGLTADDLRAASDVLACRDVDAVLGPAIDGGWWALGLAAPASARLLRRVPMSQPDTGALTYDRLTGAGLRTALLTRHRDVDTWRDAKLTAAAHQHSRFAAVVRAVAESVVDESVVAVGVR